MTNCLFSLLQNRGVLLVSGKDDAAFLQGLVSNDIDQVSDFHAIWAAFLTPQGKFLHEFIITKMGDHYVLDCEKDRRDDLATRFRRFRLRADVNIDPTDELAVAAAWGPGILDSYSLDAAPGAATVQGNAIVLVDPRLSDAGVRLIAPESDMDSLAVSARCELSPQSAYDAHRIALGLPDGSRDMEVEKALLLENGFEELGGVDFEKGCYIGQELTARTHYRGLVKKRLLPVKIDGGAPPPGTALTVEGKDAGEMKSSADGHGLALVRLATWRAAPQGILTGGAARLTPVPQPWMTLPAVDGGDS